MLNNRTLMESFVLLSGCLVLKAFGFPLLFHDSLSADGSPDGLQGKAAELGIGADPRNITFIKKKKHMTEHMVYIYMSWAFFLFVCRNRAGM